MANLTDVGAHGLQLVLKNEDSLLKGLFRVSRILFFSYQPPRLAEERVMLLMLLMHLQ